MPFYRALLIGIDAYTQVTPLHGSVNDVDKLAKLLPDLTPLPLAVRKLVAPHGEQRSLTPGASPTRANIISALQELTAESSHGDRVLVYYCGHGTSEFVPDAGACREALIPVDFNDGAGLLWDLELGGLLDRIFEASRDLTVVLDACHSAGATRALLKNARPQGLASRQVILDKEQKKALKPPCPSLIGAGGASRGLRLQETPRGYTIVAAAHSFQRSNEMLFPEGQYGILSHALLGILQSQPKEKLHSLRWADVWAKICEEVWLSFSEQQPVLIGPRENRLFGGPPGPSAEGIVLREGDAAGRIAIDAGELIGAGVDARIAVYKELPSVFPLPGSEEEQALKPLGELQVISATPFSAVGVPVAGTAPFALTPGVCGRLIASAPSERLQVTLAVDFDPDLAEALRKSAVADGIDYVEGIRSQVEAYLGCYSNGIIWLGDRVYGPGPELEPGAPGPLVRIPLGDPEKRAIWIRSLLRHYAEYVIPLRLCHRSEIAGNRKLIDIEVISCPDNARLHELLAHPESAEPLPLDRDGRIRVRPDENIAFAINNTSSRDLHFVLLCCTASGRIERLDTSSGSDVGHESRKVLGQIDQESPGSGLIPFAAGLSPDTNLSWGIDRLIAVVTNHRPLLEQITKLSLDRTFAETFAAAQRLRLGRSRDFRTKTGPLWSAVSLDVQIGVPAPADSPA